MADGFPSTPGTGRTIATDDIGGMDYQRVKLVHGQDGVNDGDSSATNPFPVKDTSSALLCGVRTAIGASALALASSTPCKEVLVQAANANATTLLVGNSGTQTYELKAGESVGVPVNDVALVYVKAQSGSGLVANWLAR